MRRIIMIIISTITCLILCTHINCSAEENWVTKHNSITEFLKNTIDDKLKKNWMDDTEPETSLKSYDLNEAIEVYDLIKIESSMIQDFYKTTSTKSWKVKILDKGTLPKINSHYYILPGETKANTHSTILLDINNDNTVSIGSISYGGNTSVTNVRMYFSEVKDYVNKYFTDDEIKNVDIFVSRNIYLMTLISITTQDDKEYIIPIEELRYDAIETMGLEKEKVYTAEEFMSAMNSTYKELSPEEIAENQKNSEKKLKETETNKDYLIGNDNFSYREPIYKQNLKNSDKHESKATSIFKSSYMYIALSVCVISIICALCVFLFKKNK